MRALLLCGYRPTDATEPVLGLVRDENGVTLIDRRIAQLRDLKLDVVCVLAGKTADEQLRASPEIQTTTLAFDDLGSLSLLSNARAGAALLDDCASFLLPVEVPVAPSEVWRFLLNEYGKLGFATEQAILQAKAVPQGAPWHFGFPLLFTRQGCQILQDNEDLTSLVDARLSYLHLAPEAKPL